MDELTMRLPCRLTPGETRMRAEELAQTVASHDQLKADKATYAARFSSQIKASERRISELGDVIRNETEYREVPVKRMSDFERNQIHTIRMDTGEVCHSRPMEAHERQSEIDFPGGGNGSDAH